MSIATEKAKQASERFMLVRLNPARFILPVSIGGDLYEITMPFLVNKLQYNVTFSAESNVTYNLTKVNAIPTNNFEWYQDESTLTVTIKLNTSPTDEDHLLIAYYYIFLTGVINRIWHENPEDSGTSLRDWQPRILSYPVINSGFDNILTGVFTVESTSIDLINNDYYFQQFLTSDDSFYNKEIKIWLCINDLENIQPIFSGTISSINDSGGVLSLSVNDAFNKIKETATMGDTSRLSYISEDAYPYIDNKKIGAPYPYVMGRYSRFITNKRGVAISGGPDMYDIIEGNECVNANYSTTISTTTNRNWLCNRQKNTSYPMPSGTISAVTTPAAGYLYVKASHSVDNIKEGDTFSWINGGNARYAKVIYSGDFTYSSVSYNLVLDNPSSYAMSVSDTIRGFTTYNQYSHAVIISRGGTFYYPLMGRDYIMGFNSYSSGNYGISFAFLNNFETNISLPSALDPNTDTIMYRSSCNDSSPSSFDFKHGTALKEMLEKAGLTTNSASFTAANTALSNEVMFQIPNFDETEYDSYLKYINDLLNSTLGYLVQNSDGEIEYHLLGSPSSTNSRDKFLILDGSRSASIDYQDIASTLIAYNPHNSSISETTKANTPSVTTINKKTSFLNGFKNIDRFRHVLKTIENKIDDHISFKSEPKIKYSLATATEDIDTNLGDDILLEHSCVFGGGGSKQLKVISIERDNKSSKIIASDLKGF